jgi:hypothetical protein
MVDLHQRAARLRASHLIDIRGGFLDRALLDGH